MERTGHGSRWHNRTVGQSQAATKDAVSGRIEWSGLVMVVDGIIEQSDSRRQRLEYSCTFPRYMGNIS